MAWVANITRVGEMRNAYKVLVVNPRLRWKNSTTIDLRKYDTRE